ncbi:uncharacterized protein BCR38DRAFT_469475 [Pseudomassariella vexata]|uniref:N-acetyltransferase domain-containing protein n=1 Tax=Pseudomassariella vexata TaxID=1141098 RepID=A0A1Y2DAQ3_9PEZI|nr:uncharacterized protein BCR38DRAFT_469475 [Pseudomassariella vexata]ORY56353.1 hypothetical protein BCR38DRAFT_469475 [Pseudomassariella vexata]
MVLERFSKSTSYLRFLGPNCFPGPCLKLYPYTLSQCTVTDGAALSSDNIPAFWADPHWILAWHHRTVEYHIAQVAKRFYYATKPDGTPAWPEAVVPAVSPKKEAETHRVADTAHWDPNCDSDLLLEPVIKIKNEILARKSYMHASQTGTRSLDYLAVHPDNQGKGVGTALIESGIREAEKMGLDIFIHAMKAEVGVYKQLGFRIEKEFIQDDSTFGGQAKMPFV